MWRHREGEREREGFSEFACSSRCPAILLGFSILGEIFA